MTRISSLAKGNTKAGQQATPGLRLQRQCACGKTASVMGECPACRKKRQGLQRQAMTPGAGAVAPPLVHQVLSNPGQPLAPATRHWMEARLGHDFSRVRVHTDPTSAASAQAVQARAYTVGQQIVFGAGAYAPVTPTGQQLLAHELTHVIQQRGHRSGGASSPAPDLMIGAVDDPLERAAAAVAHTVTPHTVTRSDAAHLQRHSTALRLQRATDMPSAQGPPDRFQQPGSATLPYREATELVECVRIMGEENAQYCRQEVLGEPPQPTPPPPPCTPTALPRAQYLAQPGTSTDDFGLTRLSGTVSVPVVQTRRVRGGFRLEETGAALPPITSVYTDAGIFTEGTAIFIDNGGAECPSGRYPMRWIIAADGARKIRDGELEHCADFQYAFAISLQRYADTVNQLAQRGRLFPSQRAAEAHVTRLVGAAPAHWSTIFECLARKTTLRDGSRGTRGWHTPRPITRPPRLSTNCAFTNILVTGSSLPEVGQHPPSEIIKDCGENGPVRGARATRGRVAKPANFRIEHAQQPSTVLDRSDIPLTSMPRTTTQRLQRQPTDAAPAPTLPAPAPAAAWSSALLTIMLSSNREDCCGIATPSGQDPL